MSAWVVGWMAVTAPALSLAAESANGLAVIVGNETY